MLCTGTDIQSGVCAGGNNENIDTNYNICSVVAVAVVAEDAHAYYYCMFVSCFLVCLWVVSVLLCISLGFAVAVGVVVFVVVVVAVVVVVVVVVVAVVVVVVVIRLSWSFF